MFHEIMLNQAIEMIKLLNKERGCGYFHIPDEETFKYESIDKILYTDPMQHIFYQILLNGIDDCRLEIWRNNKETDYISDSYTLLYNIPLHPLFSVEDNFQLYMIKNQL